MSDSESFGGDNVVEVDLTAAEQLSAASGGLKQRSHHLSVQDDNSSVLDAPDLTKYPPSIKYIMGNEMCERYVVQWRCEPCAC